MEILALAFANFPMAVAPLDPAGIANRRWSSSPAPARGVGGGSGGSRRSIHPVRALRNGLSGREAQLVPETVLKKLEMQKFASISSLSNSGTSTVSGTQYSVPIPSSYLGSPLLWIGVGIVISALFSVVATKLKRYAIQQAFKTVMGQKDGQDFSSAFSPGSPFPFPDATPSAPNASPPAPVAPQTVAEVDISAAKDEAAPPTEAGDETELSIYAKKLGV